MKKLWLAWFIALTIVPLAGCQSGKPNAPVTTTVTRTITRTVTVSPSSRADVKSLSHTAVESTLSRQLQLQDVTCNEGQDFPMTRNGASFECTSSDGRAFVVTVKNKDTGEYTYVGR